MPYSKQLAEQIEGLFEADIINRGKWLLKNNAVTSLQTEGSISACVNDPDNGSCNTFIQLEMQAGLLSVDGECSCELEFNCVHVAATLLSMIDSAAVSQTVQHAEPQAILEADTTSLKAIQHRYPDKQADKQLHFVLSLSASQLQLQLFVQSAEWVSTFVMPHSLAHPARFIQPADVLLLQQILQHTRLGDGSIFVFSDASDLLISGLIETTRCHWMEMQNPALQPGSVRSGKWFWHQHIDGSQQLMLKPQDDVTVLPTQPLMYIDEQKHNLGLLDSGLTQQQDLQLFSLPAFQVEDITTALKRVELKKLVGRLPSPRQAQEVITKRHVPTFIVQLNLLTKQSATVHHNLAGLQLSAQISFDYPAGSVRRHDPTGYIGQFDKQQFIRWQRDTEQEAALIRQWQQMGWVVFDAADQLDEGWRLKPDMQGLVAAKFIAFDLPQLLSQGWRIRCHDILPVVLSAHECLLEADFSETANERLFRLKILLSPQLADPAFYKHQPVDLLRAVFISLQLGWIDRDELNIQGQSLLSTQDQCLVIIDNHDLQLILDCLIELNAVHALDNGGYLQLSRARLQAVQSLLQSLTIKPGEPGGLLALPELLIHDGQPSVEAPDEEQAGLNAQLRPYQQQGVDWLHRLHQHRLGGLLADDMGLGKTLQILAFLWQCKCRGKLDKPVLILAPTSLLGNWQAEAERFTPGLSVLVLHGSKRACYFSRLADYDLVITSYPLLIRDVQFLLQTDWLMLILDEAQAIKNANSRSARAVREFNARINICLSGTPIENHLGELWALFDFMLPGLLGSKRQFKDWFQTPIQLHKKTSRQDLLVQRIAPVLLRRNKKKVLPQLPPKIHQMTSIELTGEQQQIYYNIEAQMRQAVRDSIQQRGVDGSRMHILNALTRLRQVCCDPRLLADSSLTSVQHSAKLMHLLDMLDEMLPQGRRILIFSQFTSLLALLEIELKKRAIDYALLTGQTRQRDQQVKRFQQGDVALFLISLKAGGSGLNLTRADTVIHYDPWWNPAVENQATDRAHRIGQHRSVMVYKLITTNTIEQKIVEMQQNKQLIADNLLEGASLQTQKTSSLDVKKLLRLLGV